MRKKEREKEHIREDKKVRKVKLILPFKISYSAKLFRYFSFFFAFIVHLLIPYLSLSLSYIQLDGWMLADERPNARSAMNLARAERESCLLVAS